MTEQQKQSRACFAIAADTCGRQDVCGVRGAGHVRAAAARAHISQEAMTSYRYSCDLTWCSPPPVAWNTAQPSRFHRPILPRTQAHTHTVTYAASARARPILPRTQAHTVTHAASAPRSLIAERSSFYWFDRRTGLRRVTARQPFVAKGVTRIKVII